MKIINYKFGSVAENRWLSTNKQTKKMLDMLQVEASDDALEKLRSEFFTADEE